MASPPGPSPSQHEPQGRFYHWSAIVDGKQYTYGGYCGAGGFPTLTAVNIFDPAKELWQQTPTSGEAPPGILGASCGVIGLQLFHFGGSDGSNKYNTIHCLNTTNLSWSATTSTHTQGAPMHKLGSAMLEHANNLVVSGGYGVLPELSDPDKYVPDPDREGEGWTNEVHCFHVDSRTWSSSEISGTPPPPSWGHSFTRVDHYRAVHFGGDQLYKLVRNHVYLLNMKSWHWTRVEASGGPGQPWPKGRQLHSAVSLHDSDSNPANPELMIMWGTGGGDRVLSDGWVFGVNVQQWRKVVLPDSLKGRFWHSTTITHQTSIKKRLIHFGGLDKVPEGTDATTYHPVAETTIVELECGGASGECVVTDVILSSQLGQPRENKDALPRHVQLTLADLRTTLIHRLKPYQKKAKPTGIELGSGTYGKVIELTSAGEIVAGKVFKTSSTIHHQVSDKLYRELSLMFQVQHPNIVQCKGVCFLTKQTMPVLLMERLMISLHAYLLDPTRSNKTLEKKVSILDDVARGLLYLHSHTPAIIHRDLTGKNVLLDSELRAKIADFGNAQIMDLDPETTPETFTSLPGTREYMPPEAEGSTTKYDPSLDVFSFGHLSLFTIIQSPVHPLLPSTYVDDEGLHARSEVKRREQYLDKAEQLLGEKHPLVLLVKQCLHNYPAQRPQTTELVTRLEGIQGTLGRADDSCKDEENPLGVPTPLVKPQMKDLVLIKTVKWYNLGLQLGIEDTELDMIEQNNPKEIDACKRRMFKAWLRITPSPSYQQLVEALQTVGETSEADHLCKKYGIEPQHSEFGEGPPTKKRRTD